MSKVLEYYVGPYNIVVNVAYAGCGDPVTVKVGVFDAATDQPLNEFEYVRDMGFYDTFYPFIQDGKLYALYSRSYVATGVLDLMTGEQIATEDENDGYGFCPVQFYVPETKKGEDKFNGQIGFVSGCYWGDDSSWKVQFLDLSKISEGIITRDDRFGYLELPHNLNLSECINIWSWIPGDLINSRLDITIQKTFQLDGKGFDD